MFHEYGCGCIVSPVQGRVRICGAHALQKATGDGGMNAANLRGVVRQYPANGEMPGGWRTR